MEKSMSYINPMHLLLLSCALLIHSCRKDIPNEQRVLSNDLESNYYSSSWENMAGRMKGNAHSGIFFIRSNRRHPLCFGYKAPIPPFVQTRNFKLEINFFYRQQAVNSKATLMISLAVKDSLIFLKELTVHSDSALNRWISFKTDLNLPASLPVNSTLSISVKNGEKTFVDVDDIEILFGRIGRPSFLIAERKEDNHRFFASFSFRPIYKNKYYTIAYSDELGDLQIRSVKNAKILTSLKYYLQWKKGTDTSFCFADKLQFIPTDKSEVKLIRLTGETKVSSFTLRLILEDDSPFIKAETKTVYKDSIDLLRESLIFDYSPDIEEVYRKNTLIENNRIRNEYWLDKEGFKLGVGSEATYFYHNTGISSIQLSNKQKEFIINLDYSKDHPLLSSFLAAKGENKITDKSFSRYKQNGWRENDFSFYVGLDAGSLPRLMKIPGGYLSAFVLANQSNSTDWMAKLDEVGSGYLYMQGIYDTSYVQDSIYNFDRRLIRPYPGFGDFFPTPNYWTNTSFAPNIYFWKGDIIPVSAGLSFNSRKLNDFIANRGIVFLANNHVSESVKEDVEKFRVKIADYVKNRSITLTTVNDLMDYWLALEKVKIRILTDKRFRIYNPGSEDINGLSLTIRADSVYINGQPPRDYNNDKNGDKTIWFDLKASQMKTITVK
jgi:hypothetical protein